MSRPYVTTWPTGMDAPAEGDVVAHHTRTTRKWHLILGVRTIAHRRTLPPGYDRMFALTVERDVSGDIAGEARRAGGVMHCTYPDATFA